tara:strand:- start:7355 stop:7987 length:633 start_codon:yes stop_codon:yes gene_type:complete
MKIKIIDNFLEEKDYEMLSSLNLKKITDDAVKVYHNSVDRKNKIMQTDCIDSETILHFKNRYEKKAINLLNELYPKKIDLYEYLDLHIIETGKNCSFPIHDDGPEKLLSGVIYLKPFINKGTIFYANKKGEERNEIEWKTNRGVFFAREERNTWHSFEGDGKSNRLALLYNLMTTKIKEVYKIENKSFLISQLRNKINPYLYRYFKTTIN